MFWVEQKWGEFIDHPEGSRTHQFRPVKSYRKFRAVFGILKRDLGPIGGERRTRRWVRVPEGSDGLSKEEVSERDPLKEVEIERGRRNGSPEGQMGCSDSSLPQRNNFGKVRRFSRETQGPPARNLKTW